MMTIYDFSAKDMAGKEVKLEEYKGKVLIIVNTASKCGLTPQLKGLETLYEKYKEQGLEILGFPCNQFMHQDPGSDEEIMEFCQRNYGVTFHMFSKIKVKGKDAHPLYQYLTEQTGGKKIEWNFAKFLINREGEIIKRFPSKQPPEKAEEEIVKALA